MRTQQRKSKNEKIIVHTNIAKKIVTKAEAKFS